MSGYNSTLGVRVRKLELASGGGNQKIYSGRIIARDEADKERQIAELLAAETITPDMMVVSADERRTVRHHRPKLTTTGIGD